MRVRWDSVIPGFAFTAVGATPWGRPNGHATEEDWVEASSGVVKTGWMRGDLPVAPTEDSGSTGEGVLQWGVRTERSCLIHPLHETRCQKKQEQGDAPLGRYWGDRHQTGGWNGTTPE